MSERIEEQFVKSKGVPKSINEDRFTMVAQGHYLDFETGTTTISRWAYDRKHASALSCFQTSVKVQPGTKVPLTLPENCEQYELLLGHKLPNMQSSNPILEEQQNLNEIQLWQGEKVIATIGPDRMAFGQFVGPLFVSATRATAILHITAFPTA